MKYYDYETFKTDTNSLLQRVRPLKIDAILAIARGGLTLSHAMAEGLNVRDVQSIRTELYDASSKRDSLTLFGTCSFAPNTKVLVVDDIADSGETLEFIMNYLLHEHPHVTFVSATLFYKSTSVFEPDFWIQEADDWIDFFWERDFKA